VHLALTAKIPGADDAAFQELAGKAKAGCPVSKLLKHQDHARCDIAGLIVISQEHDRFLIKIRADALDSCVTRFLRANRCPLRSKTLMVLGQRAPGPGTKEGDAIQISASPFGPTEAMRSMLVVPGARSGTSGDDDDALAGLRETVPERNRAGAVDHVVEIVGVLCDHAMHAPHDRQLSGGREILA